MTTPFAFDAPGAWSTAPVPGDEFERLRRVSRLGVSAGHRHPPLDHITSLAASVIDAPIAVVSLVEERRQVFLARTGITLQSTDRRDSFCQFAIQSHGAFAVHDARQDPRFTTNPLVVGAPYVRAYLAQPLLGGPGQSAIGALCVLDQEPRAWTRAQRARLVELAALAEDYLQHLGTRRAWHWSPLACATLDETGRVLHANQAFGRLVGRTVDAVLDQELARYLVPGDRSVFSAMLAHTLERGTSPTRRELRVARLSGEIVCAGTSMSPLPEAGRQVLCVIRDISLERTIAAQSGVHAAVRGELRAQLREATTLVGTLREGDDGAARGALERQLSSLGELIDARMGDIIGRMRAEELVREGDLRLRTLAEHALGPVLVVDEQSRVADANVRALELLGWSYETLVGAPARVVLPDISDAERRRWLAQGDEADGCFVALARRDGVTLRVRLKALTMSWCGPGRLVLVMTEESATQVREAKLIQERDLLEAEARARSQALQELQVMEEALKSSLSEKETLLKEIHHRVKNNLQIVSSLLSLQTPRMTTPEARAALEESASRVRSMALIHQQLYGSHSLERVDLNEYAVRLVSALRYSLAPSARVRVEADAVGVTIERAVPLGLILNELLTNAFKYGGSGDDRGASVCDVTVELRAREGRLQLVVRDSGPGLPEDFERRRQRGLGMRLLQTLTRQIEGTLTARNDDGAVFEVTSML